MMTLEALAEVIQKDFNDIRERMITKDDLKEALKGYATKEDLREELTHFVTKDDLREELTRFAAKYDFEELRDELRQRPTHEDLHEVKMELLNEIRKYRYAREIDGLSVRVTRVEKVVGIYVEPELDTD